MLVTEDGMLTGAISGGCLEGDALRKALLALHENRNKLITYDTTDDDEAVIGIQLGCNGIVHILFEPLNTGEPNALDLLKKATATRTDTVIATLFALGKNKAQPGTVLCVQQDSEIVYGNPGTDLKRSLLADAHFALTAQGSSIKTYSPENMPEVQAFFQLIHPPVSLVIFGAGNDAMPLVSIAHHIGWETTVIDGRQTHASRKRFPHCDHIRVAKADEALQGIHTDHLTVFVLMTHNYQYDIRILKQLIPQPAVYVGILGPSKKFERMLDDLNAEGFEAAAQDLEKIYSPVGLDIGAETAEQIALSVAAEIHAVLAGRDARSLKQKTGPIHNRDEQPTLS